MKRKSTYEPLSTWDIETSFSEGITHSSIFLGAEENPATPQAAGWMMVGPSANYLQPLTPSLRNSQVTSALLLISSVLGEHWNLSSPNGLSNNVNHQQNEKKCHQWTKTNVKSQACQPHSLPMQAAWKRSPIRPMHTFNLSTTSLKY